jgi:hypothetical protein
MREQGLQDYVPMDYMRCWNHHQDILARAMRALAGVPHGHT